MIYDSTPQYEHFSHLPYAQEPWKGLYVFQRLLTTVLLVPCWFFYYLLLPRSYRPRPSWNIAQIIFVNFTRRIYRVTEVAGVNFGTRDPDSQPKAGELKETRFEWAPALEQKLRRGVVVDPHGKVPFRQIGTFVWPKERSIDMMSKNSVVESEDQSDENLPVIGMYMHGGGYCQMSAHEKSRTSHIPRRLMKDKLFSEIYSVEYRLLQHAPFPAVVMDAATVYAHIVRKYYSNDFKPTATASSSNTGNTASSTFRKRCKIVLIGDSSGGNLVLAIARWLRDEKLLPEPDGLLLFSPSCDASHAFPPDPCFYVPRPNALTDYLTDTPEPRTLLQRTFLGFKVHGGKWDPWHDPQQVSQERFILTRLGSVGAASVLSLVNPVRKAANYSTTPAAPTLSLPQTFGDNSTRHECHHQNIVDHEKAEENQRLMQVVHSEYVSPASPKVLKKWGHPVDLYDGGHLCECPGDLDDAQFDCGHPTSREHAMRLTGFSMSDISLKGVGSNQGSKSHLGQGNGVSSQTSTTFTLSPESSPMPPYHVPAVAEMETLPEESRLKLSTNGILRTNNTDAPQPGTETETGSSHGRTESKASTATAVTSRSDTTQATKIPPRITITPFEPDNGEEFPTPKRHLRTRSGYEHDHDQLATLNPYAQYSTRYPQFKSLFEGFPRTFIMVGDAERLTIEVKNLARAMDRDLGCDEKGRKLLQIRWMKDAPHDAYIIPPGWWDEQEKNECWEDVRTFMRTVKEEKRL